MAYIVAVAMYPDVLDLLYLYYDYLCKVVTVSSVNVDSSFNCLLTQLYMLGVYSTVYTV